MASNCVCCHFGFISVFTVLGISLYKSNQFGYHTPKSLLTLTYLSCTMLVLCPLCFLQKFPGALLIPICPKLFIAPASEQTMSESGFTWKLVDFRFLRHRLSVALVLVTTANMELEALKHNKCMKQPHCAITPSLLTPHSCDSSY